MKAGARLSAMLLTLGVVFFGSLGEAHAAPIGMCAETAQSIEAPPPMFPSDDAVLEACDVGEDEHFTADTPGAPSERVTPSVDTPDEKVVLDHLLRAPRARSFAVGLRKASVSLPEEHRWSGLRPPRS